jgi:hypothetical protein
MAARSALPMGWVGSLYVDGQYQASDEVSQAGFTGFSRAAAVCPCNFERR